MKDECIRVYLSSTNFDTPEDNDQDRAWKSQFEKSVFQNMKLMNYPYSYILHDPLLKISDQAEIVNDDIQHIIQSHFVVCYLPRKKLSIGTLMELQYSCLFKPYHSVILIDRYKVHRNHPWIKFWVHNIVDNENDASRLILETFHQNIIGNGKFDYLKEGIFS